MAEKDEGDLKFGHSGNPEVKKRGNKKIAGLMREVWIQDSLGLAGFFSSQVAAKAARDVINCSLRLVPDD